MEHSDYYKDLVKKTNHRFPKQIKQIYLLSRKYYDKLLEDAEEMSQAKYELVSDIIFPSIAIYQAVIKYIGDADIAYEIVSRAYEDYYLEKTEKLRNMCKNSLAFYLIPSMAGDFIKKNYSEKEGFKIINRSKGMKTCHYDIVECPYHHFCKAYQCEELTTAFCDVADQAFEHLHRGISWDRTMAIGRGDDRCDFIINID